MARSRLAGDAAVNLASQVGFALTSLLSAIVTSRVLGRADKGTLAYLILTPIVLQSLLDLGTEQGLTLTIAGGVRRLRRRTLLRGLLAHGVLGLLVSSLVAVVAPSTGLGSLARLGGDNALLTAVALPLVMLNRDLSGVLCGFRQIAFLSAVRLGSAAFVTSTTVLLAALGAGSAGRFFLVFLLGIAGSVLVMALRVRHGAWLDGTEAWWRTIGEWRDILRSGLHFYGTHISYFTMTRLDSVLLGSTRPAFELGLYSNAVNLAEAIWYFPTTLCQVILPYSAGRRDRTLRRVSTGLVIAASMVGGLALAATGWLLLPALFGLEFADAYLPMLFLLPGALGMACGRIGQTWLLIYGEGASVHRINLCGAGGAALLWVVAIPRFGLCAAAVISSLAYCAIGLASLVALRRATREEG